MACTCSAGPVDGSHAGDYGHRDAFLRSHVDVDGRCHDGRAGSVDVAGLSVVMAGSFCIDEPGVPWRVVLYVDERGGPEQQQALTDIFLGRAGGTTLRNFALAIGEVYAVRQAQIELQHVPDQESILVERYVMAKTARPVSSDVPISCGIPGHDHPGQEIIAETFQVDDGALHWSVSGRCGFATSFAYSSDQ